MRQSEYALNLDEESSDWGFYFYLFYLFLHRPSHLSDFQQFTNNIKKNVKMWLKSTVKNSVKNKVKIKKLKVKSQS